ncbi:hypothetical protein VE01_10599 [Pseudogymnoascus verrucosus]|uniref:Enoyl reductase (ER) domain-containing protein n=1 Tax=Pseudogymnoascus verrucosus TaxID=342668 RepID=A0A1B8G6D1_9PEZI|nr:uncharacterized protein VE01_10599 [Pseudogymnoascus verrucosus]OBT91384.1 hypothetical protein VE01_10599 [Pseudogymnoascus verrucosus]
MVSFTVFRGSKEGSIVEGTTTREIREDEVLVKVTHSGVCGTDEHRRHTDMVLGHEGVGIIEDIGSAVKSHSIGEHVGWGYFHNSCGVCKQCLLGRDNLCAQVEKYGKSNLDQGSFGTYAVWKASFVFKLPSTISLENAAPLMCGGATVFHVLKSSNVKSSDRVGVVGIGGLGHLAIQYAAKMGCAVVAFSGTEDKKEEAMRLGATQFVATAGVETLDIGEPLDHLLVTTSFQPDWDRFLAIMAPQGSIYPVTVSDHNLSIPPGVVIGKELRIIGSLVAPRQVYREMIDFTALHNIKPIIETFPMTAQGATEAMDKLRAGKMRYRGVLAA